MPDSSQTYEVSMPGLNEPSIVKIFTDVNEQMSSSYDRLRWLGFAAVFGTTLIFLTFLASLLWPLRMSFESQRIFILAGVRMLLLSASVLILQNIHAYQLEKKNRKIALQSLELHHQKILELAQQQPKPIDQPSYRGING